MSDTIWLETMGVPLPNSVTGGFKVSSLWVIATHNVGDHGEETVEYYNVYGGWSEFNPNTTIMFETWQQAEMCAKSVLEFKKETRGVSKTSIIELPKK